MQTAHSVDQRNSRHRLLWAVQTAHDLPTTLLKLSPSDQALGLMSFALHNAAREGDDTALKALVAQGSSISVRDKHSRTPLHLSAWAGHLECCKLLVEHGAEKSSAAMDDTTALHFAAQKGHPEVVRFLLNEGTGLHGRYVIHQFLLYNCTQCNVGLCCKSTPIAGASVNGKTRKGMTPLMFGAQSGKLCDHPIFNACGQASS